ncbi:MAG: hydrogenase 3 maturation endopeptidase HyCI [Candidatus Margulisiibacteriota bacterium]|nr:hydrogenase 3 maturation endopeptidase HyCI [Candidatus Margulisiibacteriota bacterium]
MLTSEVKEALKASKAGITLIITVGNSLRSDDGLGPYIAGKFKQTGNGYLLLDAGDKPENVVDKAVDYKPAKTVIIDAADFGGAAGEVRIIPEEAIPDSTLSTHAFPLRVISKIIADDTGSKVLFIGVQSKNIALGEKMSGEVKVAAEELLKCMKCTC